MQKYIRDENSLDENEKYTSIYAARCVYLSIPSTLTMIILSFDAMDIEWMPSVDIHIKATVFQNSYET